MHGHQNPPNIRLCKICVVKKTDDVNFFQWSTAAPIEASKTIDHLANWQPYNIGCICKSAVKWQMLYFLNVLINPFGGMGHFASGL